MYSAGDKLPESTGDDASTLLEKLFQTVLGKWLHWGILYSTGEHSYTPLRNIKTVGDALILAGEYLYTPLGNIKIFWGYRTFLGLMVDEPCLGRVSLICS